MFAENVGHLETGATELNLAVLAMSWLALAGTGGLFAIFLWRHVAADGPLLPPQRHRAVPWHFAEIGLLVLLCLVEQILLATALGVEPDAAKQDPQVRAEKVLWVVCLSRPLQIASIIVGLRFLSGAQLYQFGLVGHRLAKDYIAGFLLWLAITPLVYLVFSGLMYFVPLQEHPIEKLLSSTTRPFLWMLAVLPPILLAPLAEELLFRGVIQSWMIRHPPATNLVLAVCVIAAVVWGGINAGPWPWLLLIVGGGGIFLFETLARRWLPRLGTARAIYAASILFAAIHAEVWPSPIPLFVLSLGLGWLAYRTQSIIGPIIVHSLFNAVGSVALLMR